MMDTIASGWFFVSCVIAFVVMGAIYVVERKVWTRLVVWAIGAALSLSLFLNVAVFLIAKAKGAR